MTVSKAAERITKFCLWAAREKSVRAEHLALYAYLCSVAENTPGRVFTIEAREVMKASHVRRRKAYYRYMNELDDWGFIRISKGKNRFVYPRIEMLDATPEKTKKDPLPRKPIPKKKKDEPDKKKEYAPGVLLTPKEYERLCEDYDRATVENFILQVSEYQKKKGKTYANHNATIRNWIWRNTKENERPTTKPGRGLPAQIHVADHEEGEYTDSLPYLDG